MIQSSPLSLKVRPSTTSDATPRVFIVDNDISVRESLELLIRSAGWEAETYSCAEEFLARPNISVPSCLVLDMQLPGINGLDPQERVGAERSGMPVVFISGHGDVPMTVRAMKAGAVEFLTKPLRDVLLAALEHAVQRSDAELRRAAEVNLLRDRYASLTQREREVLALVVAGRLNKQVAAQLGISEITVKAHRGKVMRKMKVTTLPDLVRIAAKLGVGA